MTWLAHTLVLLGVDLSDPSHAPYIPLPGSSPLNAAAPFRSGTLTDFAAACSDPLADAQTEYGDRTDLRRVSPMQYITHLQNDFTVARSQLLNGGLRKFLQLLTANALNIRQVLLVCYYKRSWAAVYYQLPIGHSFFVLHSSFEPNAISFMRPLATARVTPAARTLSASADAANTPVYTRTSLSEIQFAGSSRSEKLRSLVAGPVSSASAFASRSPAVACVAVLQAEPPAAAASEGAPEVNTDLSDGAESTTSYSVERANAASNPVNRSSAQQRADGSAAMPPSAAPASEPVPSACALEVPTASAESEVRGSATPSPESIEPSRATGRRNDDLPQPLDEASAAIVSSRASNACHEADNALASGLCRQPDSEPPAFTFGASSATTFGTPRPRSGLFGAALQQSRAPEHVTHKANLNFATAPTSAPPASFDACRSSVPAACTAVPQSARDATEARAAKPPWCSTPTSKPLPSGEPTSVTSEIAAAMSECAGVLRSQMSAMHSSLQKDLQLHVQRQQEAAELMATELMATNNRLEESESYCSELCAGLHDMQSPAASSNTRAAQLTTPSLSEADAAAADPTLSTPYGAPDPRDAYAASSAFSARVSAPHPPSVKTFAEPAGGRTSSTTGAPLHAPFGIPDRASRCMDSRLPATAHSAFGASAAAAFGPDDLTGKGPETIHTGPRLETASGKFGRASPPSDPRSSHEAFHTAFAAGDGYGTPRTGGDGPDAPTGSDFVHVTGPGRPPSHSSPPPSPPFSAGWPSGHPPPRHPAARDRPRTPAASSPTSADIVQQLLAGLMQHAASPRITEVVDPLDAPQPEWAREPPAAAHSMGDNSKHPNIAQVWADLPHGDSTQANIRRKSLSKMIDPNKILDILPVPDSDSRTAVQYLEQRPKLIKEMYIIAFFLASEDTLLDALKRQAVIRSNGTAGGFSAQWKNMSNAPSLSVFLERLDSIYHDPSGSISESCWDQAVAQCVGAYDLFVRLEPLMLDRQTIDRGRGAIIKQLTACGAPAGPTLTAFLQADPSQPHTWRPILSTASAVDRMLTSSARTSAARPSLSAAAPPAATPSSRAPVPKAQVLAALSDALATGDAEEGRVAAAQYVAALNSQGKGFENFIKSSMCTDVDLTFEQSCHLWEALLNHHRSAERQAEATSLAQHNAALAVQQQLAASLASPQQPVVPAAPVVAAPAQPAIAPAALQPGMPAALPSSTVMSISNTALPPAPVQGAFSFAPAVRRGAGLSNNANRQFDEDGCPFVNNNKAIYARFNLGDEPGKIPPGGWDGYPCPYHAALGITLASYPKGTAAKPEVGQAWFHNVNFCPKCKPFLALKVASNEISEAEAEILGAKIRAPWFGSA